MNISMMKALRQATVNKFASYPSKKDSRDHSKLLLPGFKLKFDLDLASASQIFTIGSCFARKVEEYLPSKTLPTLQFKANPAEWDGRPNGLLNLYNPGSIAQRIQATLKATSFTQSSLIEMSNGYLDLLLPGGPEVKLSRAVARRDEIDRIYKTLPKSDVVIITLGLTEAWYDKDSKTFLNRMPPISIDSNEKKRFQLQFIDFKKSYALLRPALEAITDKNIKVILTVSPVPLAMTFSNQDAVLASEESKATLRICASKLAKDLPLVDYFPIYEIVKSAGLSAFTSDNRHIHDATLKPALNYMLACYQQVPKIKSKK